MAIFVHRLKYKEQKMEQVKKNENKNIVLSCLKGALISVCVSLICILVFAFFIKLTNMSETLIKPINQVIKVLSILIGVLFVTKKDKQKGLVKGLVIGFLYTILAFVVFSILNGQFKFDVTILIDLVFGLLTGAICGVIGVNVKK